jgi:predicted Zn-dependent protease
VTRIYTLLDTQTNLGIIKRGTMSLMTTAGDRDFTPDELKRAYLHEVGHAFGLSGHSPNANDVMYAVVNPSMPEHLSMRDIASIRHLYTGASAVENTAARPQPAWAPFNVEQTERN